MSAAYTQNGFSGFGVVSAPGIMDVDTEEEDALETYPKIVVSLRRPRSPQPQIITIDDDEEPVSQRVKRPRAVAKTTNKRTTKPKVSIKEYKKQLKDAGYTVKSILADGNCMFNAVIDQLKQRAPQTPWTAQSLRAATVNYLRAHPLSAEDYARFQLVHPEHSSRTWPEYLAAMSKSKEWATVIELHALSHLLQTPIVVWSPSHFHGANAPGVPSPVLSDLYMDRPALNLSYQGGNHYNSLHTV